MYDIVKITWRDSKRYIEQITKDEKFEVCVIETVGFLIKDVSSSKDKGYVTITQDIIGNDLRGVLVIPQENIVTIEKITNEIL